MMSKGQCGVIGFRPSTYFVLLSFPFLFFYFVFHSFLLFFFLGHLRPPVPVTLAKLPAYCRKKIAMPSSSDPEEDSCDTADGISDRTARGRAAGVSFIW